MNFKGKNVLYPVAIIILILWARISWAELNCQEPIKTKYGLVLGTDEPGIDACGYKGIPYSAPPVGKLRFHAPEPPSTYDGTLIVGQFKPWCPQPLQLGLLSRNSSENKISEDCLYLNIWRPKKSGKFPVMVFIHGGGLLTGSSATGMYYASRLSAQEEVLVVTINYRLGVLGFLSHPALSLQDPHHSSGNYGLLDQISALKWVNENISVFGGDQNNITIFGESAGGWSVCNLLVSPLARGLFHKAIIQSGGCDTVKLLEEGYQDGEEFVKKLGCSEDDAASCLLDKSLSEILSAQKAMQKGGISDLKSMMKYTWIPKIDGWALKEIPILSLQNGDYHRVPLIIGSTRDEAKIFTFAWLGIRLAPAGLVNSVGKRLLGENAILEIKTLYPYDNYSRPADALIDAIGDATLACKCYDALDAVANFQPVYYYRFDYDDHLAPHIFGAGHAIELPFIFNTFDQPTMKLFFNQRYAKTAEPLSQIMMKYWANFAKNGNPNETGLPHWLPYDKKDKLRIYLDREIYLKSTDNIEKCEFWQRQGLMLK